MIPEIEKHGDIYIHADGSTAYIAGIQAAVITEPKTTKLFAEPDRKPAKITVKGFDNAPEMVPWGENNDLPVRLVDKAFKLPQMTSNLWFNIMASYGDGIKPVKIIEEDGKKSIVPYTGNNEVKTFFEENDINGYLLEQLTDMHWFFNVFPEIIFNKENGAARKIVEIHSKEATFSRWAKMDDQGRIPYHYYFAHWGSKQPDDQDNICTATPVLDSHRTVRHLRQIMEEDKNKTWDKRRNRFIVPVTFPTPGRSYYAKPYWYSIIESGWYDFAIQIPTYKRAVMNNQLGIRYIILLDNDYFPEIFRREKITEEKQQRKRIKKEYEDIEKFVKGSEKAGSTLITFSKKDPRGEPYPMIKIEPIRNEINGGEYIEDSEEVSNMIHYGMMAHPSLIGPSPGKNKTINGTEARELFIIKQALLKPFRDRILKPFYLIKAINQWPDDLHFVIPNLELTTLDKDKTGSVTKTSV